MNRLKLSQLVGMAMLAFVVAGCSGGKAADGDEKKDDNGAAEQPAEAAIPVEVAAAKRDRIVASYTGTTTLEAEREAQVVAKTILRVRIARGRPRGERQRRLGRNRERNTGIGAV